MLHGRPVGQSTRAGFELEKAKCTNYIITSVAGSGLFTGRRQSIRGRGALQRGSHVPAPWRMANEGGNVNNHLPVRMAANDEKRAPMNTWGAPATGPQGT